MELSEDTVLIGHRYNWGNDQEFGLSLAERRQQTYIIGQTGTGKSTLLKNILLQDVEAGRGLALIDPHGDLSREVCENIPRWRTDDVIYFDPTARYPLAINLFRATKGTWHVIASGIVSAFKKIWADSWGPRLEYVLFAAVAALIQCDNASLLGVPRMLHDARYRAWVVRQVKDPMIHSFWTNEFEHYSKNFMQEAISPIQNKVGQLFFSPAIRNILGQVGTKLNFRKIMDGRQVFIANLSRGMLGDVHSSLLGALLVTGFEIAALSRADLPPEERVDFHLCVDEFQHCATDSFVSILAEARKYRLHLTLAHQYLGQLDERVAKAVFGNVGSFISFRVGEADASVLERHFGDGYVRSHFTGLENFELCARFINQEPFRGRSLPPLALNRNRFDAVRRRSRAKFGVKQHIVEGRFDRWLPREK
jgi:hypothetical protein